ncbi:lipopolysaccharide biosynthesis protein [Flagellimonas beolgyonensis]|uniref:lipopolysaccharide biosynthesis protein n=1 Tax=Flagellimonas beolgyonensis TaxID=864064 RepID=UPI000F8D08D9|nr:oligosaccharide flippase family protein [Allomuricauda beolgyonensis]
MLKKIIAFSTSYAIIEALQKGIMFLLMSLFTYYMTTEEYGIISSALMIIQFLAIIFSLSATASISRYYFKYANKPEKLKEFLGSSFLFLFITCLVFLGVFILFGEPLFTWIFPELPFNPYLIWIFLICVLQPFNMAYLALLKAQQKLKRYTYLYSIFYALQFALMGITIIQKGMKHDGYILSLLLSNLFFMVIILLFLFKEVRFVLKREFISESFHYSISYLPTELLATINIIVDRFYILALLTLSALGVYQIAIQMGAILVLIFRALNYAYLPHFMSIYESGKKDYGEIYRFANFYVLIAVVLTGYASILSPYFIKYVLDESYIAAKDVVVYINFTYAFSSIYFINVNIMSLTPKLVRAKTLFIFIGGMVNLGLNFILIKQYGLVGAALATLMGIFITNVLLVYGVKKKTNFEFKSLKNLLYILFSFLLTFLLMKISLGNEVLEAMVMLIVFSISSILLFCLIHQKHPMEILKVKLK